jgi:hypothetical protein
MRNQTEQTTPTEAPRSTAGRRPTGYVKYLVELCVSKTDADDLREIASRARAAAEDMT